MMGFKLLCRLLIASSFLSSYDLYADRGEYHGGGHHGGGGHHHHHHGNGAFLGGVGIGYSLGYGYGAYDYYPYTYRPYVVPPTVVTVPVPVTPPIYIQQSAPAPTPVAKQYPPGYWYHCSNPEGYYPYVKDCPNGWQQVEPSPANQNQGNNR